MHIYLAFKEYIFVFLQAPLFLKKKNCPISPVAFELSYKHKIYPEPNNNE